MKLTKYVLSRKIAKKFNLSIAESERIINYTLKQYKTTLGNHDRIELRGFGSFYVTTMPARIYQHPKTGKIVAIPDSKRAVFRQSKNLFIKKTP
jgi:integration host factor subunit beta